MHGHTQVLICGEFIKFPNIDGHWLLVTTVICTQAFVETIQDKFLYQNVFSPTPGIGQIRTTPHILDLVLTNEKNMINNHQYLPGLELSDHQIWFNLLYSHQITPNFILIYVLLIL